jgi:hypothetical protein
MSELISALERERVQLETKLRHVNGLLELYATESAPAQTPKANGDARAPRRRLSSKTVAMEREVTNLLREKVQLHRSAILDDLNAKGIMGGEKNQMAHLASFLSERRHLYAADGRGNFRLAEQGVHEGERESGQPLSEPAGSDGNVAQTDRAPGY